MSHKAGQDLAWARWHGSQKSEETTSREAKFGECPDTDAQTLLIGTVA